MTLPPALETTLRRFRRRVVIVKALEVVRSGVLLLAGLAAFAVIVGLIAVDRVSGLAGRRASRLLLLAYLFLTLAYPGVKFVSEILLGRS